jgi:hypothetical protein
MTYVLVLFLGLTLLIRLLPLDAQFLVAVCFLIFSVLAYDAVGNTIENFLNARRVQLSSEHLTLLDTQQNALKVIVDLHSQRMLAIKRLATLHNLLHEQKVLLISLHEKRLRRTIIETVNNYLNDVAQKEQLFRSRLQYDIIRRALSNLHGTLQKTTSDSFVNNKGLEKLLSKTYKRTTKVK